MENKKREIAKFYEQILSDPKLKERLEEKAKKIANEEDFKNLIQQEIVPLMKKYNVNFSEKELLEYEEETLKKLSKEDFANVSGGVSIKSALLTGGILSMALLGGVGLNSSIADASGGQPKSKQQGQGQQQKSRRTVRKPKVKITEVTMSSDDDDDSRPSQKGEVKKTADKTKKVEEKSKQNDNDDKIQKEENEKPKPAIRKKQKKVEEESKKTDNDDDDIMQKESKKSKKVEESNQNNSGNNSNDNRNNNDNGQRAERANARKPNELNVLIQDIKEQKRLYKTAQALKILSPTLEDDGYVEYMDLSELHEFISNLRVDDKFRFYTKNHDTKKKKIIENEDIAEIVKFCRKHCRGFYIPKNLFEDKGNGIYKAIIFGDPYTINAAFEKGEITYNYTDLLEIINNTPIEVANYPQFFIDAIDDFRKEGSKLNDKKIGQLKYENKLENGEETIDKAALRLGEFYKEFLRLTRSDTKRTESVSEGEYDPVLVRKFWLLNETTRNAVIKCTEEIAKKIKQSGELYYIEDTFANYTIDTNCLKMINGFNQIMPDILANLPHKNKLTYTPCTKGIMGESLASVASRLIDVLKKGVYQFRNWNIYMYIEGLSGTEISSDKYLEQENLIDENFNKIAASAQKNGRALNLDTIFGRYNKELLKNVKDDIEYLHQYMKPNSDGSWSLKGSMFSRGSKIDGLGMIDYFYNAPVLSLWDYEPCQKEELDAEDLSAAAQNLIKFLTEYTNLAQKYYYRTFTKPMNSYSGTLDEKFDQFIGQVNHEKKVIILDLDDLNKDCQENVKEDIKYLCENMHLIDKSIDGLKMIRAFS